MLIISCSDDDKTSSNSSSSSNNTFVSFDGKDYTIQSAIIFDYGPDNWFSRINTHYNFDFNLLDAPIVKDTSSSIGYTINTSTSISIYVELYSPDTTSFIPGTFNYINNDSLTVNNTLNKFFFTIGEIELDSNGVVNEGFDGGIFKVVGGTVIVTGSGNTNYNITYNLQFEGNRNLNATYYGPFKYFDLR